MGESDDIHSENRSDFGYLLYSIFAKDEVVSKAFSEFTELANKFYETFLAWYYLGGRLGNENVPAIIRRKMQEEDGQLTGPFGFKGKRWREAYSHYWKTHRYLTDLNVATRELADSILTQIRAQITQIREIIEWAESKPEELRTFLAVEDIAEDGQTVRSNEECFRILPEMLKESEERESHIVETCVELQKEYENEIEDPWDPNG